MSTPETANQDETLYLSGHDGSRIAYRRIEGNGPTILWLGGFKSDMSGSKAQAIADAALANGWDFLRFDYAAHGASDGVWAEARVGHWRQNVLDVVDHLTHGPLVVVGSSMGGWMASLLMIARPERIGTALFIAPAPDFATALMLPNLSPEDRHALMTGGAFNLKGYDEDVLMSQAFFDEAEAHTVLGAAIAFEGQVHILHGMKDDVVPWTHGVRLAETLTTSQVRITLIKDGDHRLSRPQYLDLLIESVSALRASQTA